MVSVYFIYTLGIMPPGILADRMARKNVVATTLAAWCSYRRIHEFYNALRLTYAARCRRSGLFSRRYCPHGNYYSREKRSRILS